MSFPLTPRSMTLDDLELRWGQILLEFRDISRVSEAMTAKWMKIDPHCQQRSCCPLNVLFSDVQIALISQVVPRLEGVKQRWDSKNKSPYKHGCRALTWRQLGFLVGNMDSGIHTLQTDGHNTIAYGKYDHRYGSAENDVRYFARIIGSIAILTE